MSEKRFPSPTALLNQVGRAWPVMLAVWLSQLGLAWLLAAPTRGAAKAAAGQFGYLEDGHLLFSIIELLEGSPAVAAALVGGVVASAALGFLMWLVFAGAIFNALRGDASVGRSLGAGINAAPRVAVQALYVSLLRGLLIAPAFLPGLAGKIAGAVGGLVVLVTIPAFDRVRAVVTDPAASRAFHPKQLIHAVRDSVKQPIRSLPSVFLWIGSWVVTAAVLAYVTTAPQQAATIWIARGASLIPLVFGVLRFALVLPSDGARASTGAATGSSTGAAAPSSAAA